jgi:hypothetical protein
MLERTNRRLRSCRRRSAFLRLPSSVSRHAVKYVDWWSVGLSVSRSVAWLPTGVSGDVQIYRQRSPVPRTRTANPPAAGRTQLTRSRARRRRRRAGGQAPLKVGLRRRRGVRRRAPRPRSIGVWARVVKIGAFPRDAFVLMHPFIRCPRACDSRRRSRCCSCSWVTKTNAPGLGNCALNP